MGARAKHHDLAVHRLAVVLYHGDHEPQLRVGGMEHQHHALRAHSPDMRICRSGRHTYQERHRTAIARMVRVRHHLHPQRILAEKSRFQHQRPLLPARSRRCANPHHLVGHTFPVFRTRQTTVCTQRWQPSPSPSPHSLSTPDGSASISFL
jgi:hypothetical protein